MISGPILPRTPEGLWDVVRSDPQRLERGLRLVRRELVLEGGLVVDALGGDAVGRPVLLFGAWVDRDRDLPSRIVEAREWFARNGRLLGVALEGARLRLDLTPRIFVVGFEFTDTCLDRLRRSGDPDLFAFRVEGFYLDGVRHLGAVRLLDGGGVPEDELGAIGAGGGGVLARRFATLIARLDHGLTVDDEVYARTWRLQGATVARLQRRVRLLEVTVPGCSTFRLRDEEDVVDAFDAAMRRYLDVLSGVLSSSGGAQVDPVAELDSGAPELLGGALSTLQSAAARGDASLDTEITADEYEAFFQDDRAGGGA